MGIIRDSFVIFKNWADAINTLPEEYQLETYKAVVAYGTSGEIPQDISPIAKAMLISFSKGMENSLAKYVASVENGKKGGRPKREQPDQENENPEKPSETQNSPTEPTSNLNVTDTVTENVNVFSQLIKNAPARVSEKTREQREPYVNKFENLWRFGYSPEKGKLLFEIIDTLIEAREQAASAEKLLFDRTVYDLGSFDKLMDYILEDDINQIAWSLKVQEVKNRPYYILGALINRAKIKSQ